MERADCVRGSLLGMTALSTAIYCALLGFASPAKQNIEVHFNNLQSKYLRASSPIVTYKGSKCTSYNALLANKHQKFLIFCTIYVSYKSEPIKLVIKRKFLINVKQKSLHAVQC